MATLYYFADLNEKGCLKERFSYRWPVFLGALARVLRTAIALVDPYGQFLSFQNSVHPVDWFLKRFEVTGAYRDFFRRIPQIYRELPEDKTVLDPLGFPVTLARLEDGCYLLLGGRLKQDEPEPFSRLSKEFPAMEVREQEKKWLRLPVLKQEKMKENLALAAGLINELNRYLDRPDLPALLSVVSFLEQVIVSVLDLIYFDFKAILELITAALVVLSGEGGAFAFTFKYPGQTKTLWCGEHQAALKTLSEKWTRLGMVAAPGESFSAFLRDSELKTLVKGVHFQNNGASIYLGLIGTKGIYLQEALHALVSKAAVALGVSSISTAFPDCCGAFFNLLNQGIVIVDNKAVVLIMNQAAKELLKKRGINPVIGHSIERCGLGSPVEEVIFSVTQNGCGFKKKNLTIGEGSAAAQLSWEAVPLFRHDGQSIGAVLVFTELTAAVQLKEKIRDWGRLGAAGEPAAGLIHEVRNTLATSKAAIQLLRMDETPSRQKELLEKIDRELDRTNSLLNNFLNFARPVQGEKLKPIDLEQTLGEFLIFLSSKAALHEIDLVTSKPREKLPVVLGSPNEIKQVCLNVALNAIEAMSDGGKLVVSLFSKNSRVHIRFQDNGPGIPSENLAALTRPFFTTKPGGTGLGLTISAAIAKAMGGSLEIDSSPGKGTAVELSLPVHTEPLSGIN